MFRVVNTVLGQSSNVVSYTCPPDPAPGPNGERAYPITYAPDLNCMRDARGNTICSDGMHYPPGCPKTPPDKYFSPGVTPDVITNGMIEGQVPPPKSSYAASNEPGAPGSTSPALLVGAGVLGTAALAAIAYFGFLKG